MIGAETIATFVIHNRRIALWLTKDKEVILTNGLTGKSLLCLSVLHGLDVFDSCVKVFKEGSEAKA